MARVKLPATREALPSGRTCGVSARFCSSIAQYQAGINVAFSLLREGPVELSIPAGLLFYV